MKKGWLSVVIIIVLLGVVFYFNQSSSTANRDTRPEIGFKAPDFTLKDVNDNNVSLSNLRGKPVFINFWASWCPPCQEEMPFIQQAYEKYKDKVIFLGVNVTAGDDKDKAVAFMKANDYEMPVLFDYDADATKEYRANSIPTSFFVDKNGVIKEKSVGALTYSQLEAYLQEILGE